MEELDWRLREIWERTHRTPYPGSKHALRDQVLRALERQDDDPHRVKETRRRVRAQG